MPIDIIMPAMSPTMESGSVSIWKTKIGDKIKSGDIIAEIETDKAIMELESMDEGVIGVIFAPAGTQNIPVGNVIGIMLKEGETEKDLKNYKPSGIVFLASEQKDVKKNSDSEAKKIEDSENINTKKEDISNAKPSIASNTSINNLDKKETSINFSAEDLKNESTFNSNVKSSPLARRIALNRNINIEEVFGTGPEGRVIKRDVMNANAGSLSVSSSQDKVSKMGRISKNQQSKSVPLSSMRKVIAKRLTESKTTVPHFYLESEVSVYKMLEMRQEINNMLAEKVEQSNTELCKISVNDLILKAVAIAIEQNPSINVQFAENEIIHFNTIDICMAISLPNGLIAPKICDVNLKNIQTISVETKSIISRAKKGKITSDELTGGSLSVSNLGMMGIDAFFPIINPPQSAIIGIGRTKEVLKLNKEGSVIKDLVLKVTLSADHRSVDGSDGAKFLESLCQVLSNPLQLFVF